MKVNPLLSNIDNKNFVNQYLSALGIDNVDRYLCPDVGCKDNPWIYPNMDKAVVMLNECVCNRRKIGLLVDVDCDGMCSATLIRQFLNKTYNIDPIIYIRKGKAHGLRSNKSNNENIVEQIINDKIQLMIIPDAGSNDADECKELLLNGCNTIILDHHNIEVDNPWAIVVNHHLLDEVINSELVNTKLNTALSGAGVTSKFIEAYCDTYSIETPYMDDLVAMSIFSDSCSLTSMENRYYVYGGMNRIENEMLKTMMPLMERYGVNPTGYSWAIIPLINAVCRQEETENKYILFDALSGHSDIEKAIAKCKSLHAKQKTETQKIIAYIEPTLDLEHNVIIGFANPEDANLIGLVANNFMSKYNKPVILLRQADSTNWSGSLRSPIDLSSIINDSGLAKAMGHSYAAGVLCKKSNLQRLIDYLDNSNIELNPSVDATAIINSFDITVDLCKEIESHKDLYGQGVAEPTFLISAEITQDNVNIYQKKTTTIKVVIDGISFLLFMANQNQLEKFNFDSKKKINMIVTLNTNEFNGVISAQGKIKQFELEDVKENEFDWDKLFA